MLNLFSMHALARYKKEKKRKKKKTGSGVICTNCFLNSKKNQQITTAVIWSPDKTQQGCKTFACIYSISSLVICMHSPPQFHSLTAVAHLKSSCCSTQRLQPHIWDKLQRAAEAARTRQNSPCGAVGEWSALQVQDSSTGKRSAFKGKCVRVLTRRLILFVCWRK